jgi:uncharacterized RDD family membrane protein YckC
MSAPPPPSSPYGAAPTPPPGPSGLRPGELLDRFLARLVDSALLVVVGFVVNGVLLGALLATGGLNSGLGMGTMSFSAYGVVSALVTAAIYLGYYGLMESSRGQTIGKMVTRLHVQGVNGGNPTIEEALKRNIWLAYPILGVIPFLGFLAGIAALVAVILIAVQINNDVPEHRPWTDRFAGTRVLKEG